VKGLSEKYEKEVERRGKREIGKRKVDKISFSSLLQIESMLMKEEEEEQKEFVKNNLVPALPFLLYGSEKEREEKESDGEDVENVTVFQFFWDYLLSNDSLRPLLLLDERKILLNKTLLFSLRRDSPFTRRECLNVLEILFSYGKEKEVRFVISSGGMKCVVLKIGEKEEREENVNEKGNNALRYCLSNGRYGDRIPRRRKEGWKGEKIMREMMCVMEEEDVKETVIMSYPYGIDYYDVPSFNYGLGIYLHVLPYKL
jgi:hypothetical protein